MTVAFDDAGVPEQLSESALGADSLLGCLVLAARPRYGKKQAVSLDRPACVCVRRDNGAFETLECLTARVIRHVRDVEHEADPAHLVQK